MKILRESTGQERCTNSVLTLLKAMSAVKYIKCIKTYEFPLNITHISFQPSARMFFPNVFYFF